MNPLDIFNKVVDVLELKTIEVITGMIVLTLLIWLSKEFKVHHQNETKVKLHNTKQLSQRISKVLAVANEYKTNHATANDFFSSVFSCLPLLNAEDTNRIYELINNQSVSNDEKIEEISSKLYLHLERLNHKNHELFPLNSGFKMLEYIATRFTSVFLAPVQALITLSLIGLMFSILFGGGNDYFNMLKVISFLYILMVPFGFLDLIIDRKVNVKGILFIIGNIAFIIIALTSKEMIWLIISLLIAITFLIVLFIFGLKKQEY